MQKILILVLACGAATGWAQESVKYPLPVYKMKTNVASSAGITAPIAALQPSSLPAAPAASSIAESAPTGASTLKLDTAFTVPPPPKVTMEPEKETVAEKLPKKKKSKKAKHTPDAAPAPKATPANPPATNLSNSFKDIQKVSMPVDLIWDSAGNATPAVFEKFATLIQSVMNSDTPPKQIRVTGFADQQASASAAMKLSKEQTSKFANLMIDMGVPFDRIAAYSKGNLAPIQNCNLLPDLDQKSCHRRNRQIVVEFVY